MDVPQTSRSRSLWADLDALVLEEVDALRAGPHRPAEAPDFASEEAFLARASLYLRGHPDPEALVERLRIALAPDAPAGDAPPAAGDEPPPAQSGGEEAA